MTTATTTQTNRTKETAGAESELRAAARRRGLTMKELAALMGVSAGYLSQIANGGRPWTPKMREKVAAVLGEVPGQGIVYRQGGVVTGESSFIRERARTLGMTMQDLADRVGRVLRLHDAGGPWPPEHGRQGPGQGRVGVARLRRRSRPPSAPTARASSWPGRAATSGSGPGSWA